MEPAPQQIKTKTAAERSQEKQSKIKRKRALWLSIAGIIIALDQLSKWYVTEIFLRPRFMAGESVDLINWYINTPSPLRGGGIYMTSFFNLVMAWNTGVSFSMFSGQGFYTWLFLIIVALGITCGFLYWMWNEKRHMFGICYALVIGGALGNVIDRIRFGAVIDFLDFHVFGHHWPAFNVADMAVVTGISLLIIVSLFFDITTKDRYRKRKKKERHMKKMLFKRFGATHIITRKK